MKNKPDPAPTLRQILRFRGIDSSLDVKRRYEAKRTDSRRAARVGKVRGIEVEYIESELIEI